MVVEILEDWPGEHDPETAADPEQTRDERDPAGDALARELVSDDSEGQWEHRPADALNRACRNQHRQRGREGGDQRAATQPGEHDEQRPLLPEHVAQPTCDWSRD